MDVRDIRADYIAAYRRQYDAYQRAGDAARAESVAVILRDQYGVDVGQSAEVDPVAERQDQPDPVPERADQSAPEAAVESKPKRRGRPRLPRDADGNIIREAKPDAEG